MWGVSPNIIARIIHYIICAIFLCFYPIISIYSALYYNFMYPHHDLKYLPNNTWKKRPIFHTDHQNSIGRYTYNLCLTFEKSRPGVSEKK